jgi:hypothetical protein
MSIRLLDGEIYPADFKSGLGHSGDQQAFTQKGDCHTKSTE